MDLRIKYLPEFTNGRIWEEKRSWETKIYIRKHNYMVDSKLLRVKKKKKKRI